MTNAALAEIDRGALAALADALIPAAPGHLSASEAGIAGPLLDKVAAIVPERLALFSTVIAKARGSLPEDALEALRREDAILYDAFCETIAAAYFMASQVRDHVRFPGRVPVPARSEVADMEELLMPVLEAGFAPRGLDV